VQVADPEVGPDRGHVDRQHPRRMGGVDQDRDVDGTGGGGDLPYRKDLCRGGGELIDDEQLGAARAQGGPDPCDGLVRRRGQRQRDRPSVRPGAPALPPDGE
jgi:hypothetical protein